MRSRLGLFALLSGMLAPPAFAQTEAQDLLRTVRTLKCQFTDGYIVNLATNPVRRDTASIGPVVYDSIDRTKGHARVIGTTGSADMGVFVGVNALTFIEIIGTGTPVVTVVYGQFRLGTNELLAVMSRHLGHLGPQMPAVIVGQYYGTCRQFE